MPQGFENFELTFGRNLAGLTAFTASEGPFPTGVYKVQVTGGRLVNKKKDQKGNQPPGKNIELTMKVVECFVRDATERNINPAQQVGREMRKWIPAPGTGGINAKGESTDETGLRQIRALMESFGHPAEIIDQLTNFQPGYLVQFDAQGQPLRDAQGNLQGRIAYLHNVESNRTQDGDSNFIAPEKYELYRANQWTPDEQGTPRQDTRGGGGSNLPNVGALPNVASAMTGINPTAAGTAPPAGLGNPAFANAGGQTPPVVPTQPANNGAQIGGLIR